MTTIKNQYNIKIKKGCCSCQFRQIDNQGERICSKMELKVSSNFCCPRWQMSDGLKNAGKAKGIVKKLTEIIIF
jgi:hypothetical protein